MTTDATNVKTEEAVVPAAPAKAEVDEKGLRRIGYVLMGATAFSGVMAVYASLHDQDAQKQFNTRAEISRPAKQSAKSSYTMRISSSQFMR